MRHHPSARTWRFLTTLAVVAAALAASPAAFAGQSTRPLIASLSTAPARIPVAGGRVVVSVHVQNAQRCTFFGQGRPGAQLSPITTVSCSSGTASATIPALANAAPHPVWLLYTVRARGVNGTSSVQSAHIIQSFSVKTSPLVVPTPTPTPNRSTIAPAVADGACTPGPDCLLPTSGETFPTYNNIGTSPIADCTFAAAADWEQIVRHVTPDPALIIAQFEAAGGDDERGLSLGAYFGYWQTRGIGGIVAQSFTTVPLDKASLESAVRARTAVLAGFQFRDGDVFGPYTLSGGAHMTVVDGFTPTGPLVVTWGQTLQITWAQWDARAFGAWSVSAA